MKKYIGILIFIIFIVLAILLVKPLEFEQPINTPTKIIPTSTRVIPTNTPIPTATSTVGTLPSSTVTQTPIPIPTKTPTNVPTVEPIIYPTPMGGLFYEIVKDDNLWNIAVFTYEDGTKYIWICKANNLMHNCSLIHAGNQLWLPEYWSK